MRRFDFVIIALVIVLAVMWLPRVRGWVAVATQPGLTPEERAILSRTYRVLSKDDILPIYHPQFVSAAKAPYSPDELVLGAEIGGDAKAYPITILRGREMVNDELHGVPILVTW